MTHGLALIGCGHMARIHCDQVSRLDNLRMVCAIDLDLDRARQFQTNYGFERVTSDYRTELAKKDFDIVLVCSYWQNRFEIIRDCFAAGKHVLAEKPLSLYLDEIDTLTTTAKAQGLKLRVGFMERFRPMIHKISELLKSGAIGKPLVYSFVHHQAPRASGLKSGWDYYKRLMCGGVTPNVDCGIHKCDMTRLWAGCEAVSVFSAGQKLAPDSPANNFSHSVYTLADGSILTLEDCFSNNTEPFIHMTILGDRGRIEFEYAGNHLRATPTSEEDCIRVWHGDTGCTETFHTPLRQKPVGPQMEEFIREIEANADMEWHYQNVRQATEMVIGSVLSEQQENLVRFPLSPEDLKAAKMFLTK
ncbi:MAG: Gfo/Idh/MocA family oxidoreductase [Phycisphaerae bacterium]